MTFVSLLLEDDVSIAKYACLVLPDLLSILLKLLCIVCVWGVGGWVGGCVWVCVRRACVCLCVCDAMHCINTVYHQKSY